MDNEVKTWLKDIEQAISEIHSFLPEAKHFTNFQKDLNQASGREKYRNYRGSND